MNFGDKLSQLRKKNGFSQEELGEKLNVTRQTISKWELNQTKPDTDKLMEICRVLDVNLNQLVDDKIIFDNNKINANIKVDEGKPRKWLLILLIIIAIVISVVLVDKVVRDIKSSEWNMFIPSENNYDFDKSYFNSTFEMKSGTNPGTFVSILMDDVITNNKTNDKHMITVVFGDLNSSNPKEIKEAKKNINSFSQYEVSLDYDENGYVNMVTIESLE